MRNKCLLGLTLAAFLLPAPLLAETRKAQTYLNWCQNNVRDGAAAKAAKHCGLYRVQAATERLGVWSQSAIKAAVAKKRRLVAAKAPTPSKSAPSTHKSETPVSISRGVPNDWDEAWHDPRDLDGKDSNGESTPYVKDLIAKMGSDLLGSGFTPGQAYLSRTYSAYNTPAYFSGRGKVYVRHTGTDFMKPIGSTVRALAPGQVVATYNDPRTSNQALAVVKEDGADRWWVYLHTSYRVKKGQRIAKGAVIGTIADPRGEWRNPHVHVNVMTTWPISPAVAQYLSLGRSYHPDKGEAIRFAKTYTMNPLEAYALANGLLP